MGYLINPKLSASNNKYLGAFPFAQRPLPALCAGCYFNATDLNYAEFYSDGTNWRPRGGRAQIALLVGLPSAPLATISATGKFSLPGGDILIPAGLITPKSKLCAITQTRKTGATSTASVNTKVGIGSGGQGANSDAYLNGGQHTNTNLGDMKAVGYQAYGSSRTKATTGGWQSENSSSYSSVVELISGINADVDMYASCWAIALTAPDTLSLLTLQLWLEG
jgi:hypothetical protein